MKIHPNHIALIMDGNNRFSKTYNLSLFEAYKLGAEKLLKISKYIFSNYDTKVISAFALSHNNTKRPKYLINTLINVLDHFIDNNKDTDLKFDISFRGDLSFLPKKIFKKISDYQFVKGKNNKKLIIYINYSGQRDIIKASYMYKKNNIDFNEFQKLLCTNNISDPNILIRTGGFKRISDFFLFQIAFTELFFIKKLWPEISSKDIYKIFKDYSSIERKFGY